MFKYPVKKKIITPEDILPKYVENSNGKINSFDAKKIYISIMKETGLPAEDANRITIETLRKIAYMDAETITAPHIRELACAEMSYKDMDRARAKYTRVGMPVYDVGKIIDGDHSAQFQYLYVIMEVIVEYMHIKGRSENVDKILSQIKFDASSLCIEEEKKIIDVIKNSEKLYYEKLKEKTINLESKVERV